MATIEFLGGAGTVTGSKFLVEADMQKRMADMMGQPEKK